MGIAASGRGSLPSVPLGIVDEAPSGRGAFLSGPGSGEVLLKEDELARAADGVAGVYGARWTERRRASLTDSLFSQSSILGARSGTKRCTLALFGAT